MKKISIFTLAMAIVVSFTALVSNTISAQTAQKGKPIPDDVVNIAKKSCLNCHAEPGKALALAKVNLSKWNTYTSARQAAKAADMCSMVTKGKMPPKEFKQKNPGFVITKEEIKTICDWSSSLQMPKK
jgi:hypothetical protein